MPSHRIQPCPPSIPYVTHTARNSTHATQRQAQGRGGTRQGCRRGGGRQQQAVARLSPILLTPPTTQTAWRKSVKTLTDLVMIISSYVFCLSGVFSLYYFVLNETLGSVTCGICCWGTDLSAADEAKTNISFFWLSRNDWHVNYYLLLSACPNGAFCSLFLIFALGASFIKILCIKKMMQAIHKHIKATLAKKH